MILLKEGPKILPPLQQNLVPYANAETNNILLHISMKIEGNLRAKQQLFQHCRDGYFAQPIICAPDFLFGVTIASNSSNVLLQLPLHLGIINKEIKQS